MRQSRLIPILLLLLALLLAACGGSATPTTNTPAPAEPTTAAAEPTAEPESGEADQPLAGGELTIYSGRNEELVGPLIEQFEAASGIDVSVRYGNTAEMAAAILEEGGEQPRRRLLRAGRGRAGRAHARGDARAAPLLHPQPGRRGLPRRRWPLGRHERPRARGRLQHG